MQDLPCLDRGLDVGLVDVEDDKGVAEGGTTSGYALCLVYFRDFAIFPGAGVGRGKILGNELVLLLEPFTSVQGLYSDLESGLLLFMLFRHLDLFLACSFGKKASTRITKYSCKDCKICLSGIWWCPVGWFEFSVLEVQG